MLVLGLLLFLFSPLTTSAATFYSTAHGNWHDLSTWNQDKIGKAARRLPGPNDYIVITHTLTFDGNLHISKCGFIYVLGIGELHVEGNVTVATGGTIWNYSVLEARQFRVAGMAVNYGAIAVDIASLAGRVENLGDIRCHKADLEPDAVLDSRYGTVRVEEDVYEGVRLNDRTIASATLR